MTIIEWLNENVDAGDAIICVLIAYVVWFLLWKAFLKRFFSKSPIGSIGDHISELGATATFGICFLLLVVVSLFVTSIQAVFVYELTLLLPLTLFWGAIGAFVIFLIKVINKK